MRLAAQAKCGFYPANPHCVSLILKHLRTFGDRWETQAILDPCAGEGLAIRQIAEGLGLTQDKVYCVELDQGRTNAIRANLPDLPARNLLGPATYLGVQISPASFGLVYCNPPFDHELGGGRREELAFVATATRHLAPRGILCLVCPMAQVIGNRTMAQFLDGHFEDIEIFKFPDGTDRETGQPYRPYYEVAVFARKRKTPIPRDSFMELGTLHKRQWDWRNYINIDRLPPLGSRQPVAWNGGEASYEMKPRLDVWEIPNGSHPHVFKKTAMTEDELAAALAESPLHAHFRDVPPLALKRPPLPLDKGHLGLILASGMLDGVVQGPFGPHVVRGSSMKKEYHNKQASTNEANPDTGAVTTKDVYSQRMVTVIRAVTDDGTIHTFSNDVKDEGGAEISAD